jgi:hypothetical protein
MNLEAVRGETVGSATSAVKAWREVTEVALFCIAELIGLEGGECRRSHGVRKLEALDSRWLIKTATARIHRGPSDLTAGCLPPSGSRPYATAATRSVWAMSGSPTGWLVAGSHSRTVFP